MPKNGHFARFLWENLHMYEYLCIFTTVFHSIKLRLRLSCFVVIRDRTFCLALSDVKMGRDEGELLRP